ncbi:unnamed protein product [Psylliodes chrysocephalus]|uniref:Uncharacterized protein n=1 Tax=Psylliodes chrysocephalus TaxID=3402493 RepID=A0A9P0GCF3_9CUCU|nr:unnamed protein product [Psylliodes chrysocephala]
MALLKLKPFLKINSPILTKALTRNLEATSIEQSAPQKFTLDDKVAVVTGGASGIGFAIAKEFLKNGLLAVNILDIDKRKLLTSTRTLKQEFGEDRVISSEVDVADAEQMDNILRNTSVDFEGIDIIVNNAGVLDDTNWENQLDTNIRGSVIGTLLGMQYMAKTSSGEGGIIVNIGSSMSITPACGFPIHTLTQFGIAGFTRALGSSKLYERTGVKIFGFCPGLTDTNALKQLEEKAINHNFVGEFEEEMKDVNLQDPVNVAKGLVEVLGDAQPGSIWIVENNKSPFELEFPKIIERKKIEREETQQSATDTTQAKAQ